MQAISRIPLEGLNKTRQVPFSLFAYLPDALLAIILDLLNTSSLEAMGEVNRDLGLRVTFRHTCQRPLTGAGYRRLALFSQLFNRSIPFSGIYHFRATEKDFIGVINKRFNGNLVQKMSRLCTLNLSYSKNCYLRPCLRHLKKLTQLHTLNLSHCYQICDCDGTLLSGLTQLRHLNLSGCSLTNLGYLGRFTLLTTLHFPRCSDDQLIMISPLTGLQSLDLSHCQLTEEKLEHLKGLTRLKNLDLSNGYPSRQLFGQIKGTGLVHLRGLSALETLALSYRAITDHGVEILGSLTTLRKLKLNGSSIDSANMVHLSRLTSLRYLDLSNCDRGLGVTDEGLVYLKSLVELRVLNLSKSSPEYASQITGVGLEHLVTNNVLQELDLSCCQISSEGWEALGKLVNFCHLRLRSTSALDLNSAHLSNLIGLKSLDLSRSLISNATLAYIGMLTTLESLNLASPINIQPFPPPFLFSSSFGAFCGLRSPLVTFYNFAHLTHLTRLHTLILTRMPDAYEHNPSLLQCVDKMPFLETLILYNHEFSWRDISRLKNRSQDKNTIIQKIYKSLFR